MKKIIYAMLGAGMMLSTTACSDYLDTSSPSVVDADLVFSNAETTKRALLGAYVDWAERNNKVHSLGLFYDMVVCGSDSERHAEIAAKYLDNNRAVLETLFPNIEKFSIDYTNAKDAWTYMYQIIVVCNNVINSVEQTDAYKAFMISQHPTELSQVYGEAVALRATAYFELLRYFGDIPHKVKTGDTSKGFTSRDEIYEYHINKLIEAEPLMYRVGEGGTVASSMNRTYVQGLIGRMCLYAGGYATRRTDLGDSFYKNLKGEALTFENFGPAHNGAVYCRRTDYKEFYKIAEKYLSACVENPGAVKLITKDDRSMGSKGQLFGNPYQRKYQYMNDRQISPESVYEIVYQQGAAGSERPYSYGRGSDGGDNAYPCKSFGQSRFYPTYYYGDFDNKDLRRDVTVAVTGSTGKGFEVLTTFKNGSKGTGGGLANNKWDENRMTNPYTKKQRQSGISCLYMSFSDIVLMLAEVQEELGESGKAQGELKKVHERAYASSADADLSGFITKYGGLKNAIQQERKLEFGGEGYRRWDLIRTGKLPEAAVNTRKEMKKVLDGLKANGYYTFENGNQISAYIWTKSVDSKSDSKYGYRLTTQCPTGKEDDPVLFPGWRGQNDEWEKFGCTYTSTTTNLAIKGLFKYIEPGSAEALALEADGYKKVAWGADLLTDEMIRDYTIDPFCGYTDEDYAAKRPPLYLCPLSSTTLEKDLTLSNGYGFTNK